MFKHSPGILCDVSFGNLYAMSLPANLVPWSEDTELGLIWLSSRRVIYCRLPKTLAKSLLIPSPSTLSVFVWSKYNPLCLTDEVTKVPSQERVCMMAALHWEPSLCQLSSDVQSPNWWHHFLLQMWSRTCYGNVQGGLRSPKCATSALRDRDTSRFCLPVYFYVHGIAWLPQPSPCPPPPPSLLLAGASVFTFTQEPPGFPLKCQSVANQGFICQVGLVARNDLPPPCVI